MSTDKKNPAIIHELTDEQLMELALGADTKVVFDKITEAGKFIYACGVKHGKAKIRPFIIYYEYKQWKEANQIQSQLKFFKDFKKYFQPERDKDGLYYLLNEKPFDTSQEQIWYLRAIRRREKARKKD